MIEIKYISEFTHTCPVVLDAWPRPQARAGLVVRPVAVSPVSANVVR